TRDRDSEIGDSTAARESGMSTHTVTVILRTWRAWLCLRAFQAAREGREKLRAPPGHTLTTHFNSPTMSWGLPAFAIPNTGRKTHVMMRLFRIVPGLVMLLGIFATTVSPSALPAEQEPFQPLFNGKDFSGWVTPSDPALFSVENGEIVGRTIGKLKKNEFL